MPVRRRVLLLGAVGSLAACTRQSPPPPRPSSSTPTVTTTSVAPRHDRLVALEAEFGARLGVFASGAGGTVEYRADERFAFCSSFKGLAAGAILHRNPLSHLDKLVTYTEADLLPNAAVTPRHVGTGMTIRDLCDAAVRYSDGTAGNLLLRDLGGPAELTAFTRELGDTVTRMDRIEPDITEARQTGRGRGVRPGDHRRGGRVRGRDHHMILRPLGGGLITGGADTGGRGAGGGRRSAGRLHGGAEKCRFTVAAPRPSPAQAGRRGRRCAGTSGRCRC